MGTRIFWAAVVSLAVHAAGCSGDSAAGDSDGGVEGGLPLSDGGGANGGGSGGGTLADGAVADGGGSADGGLPPPPTLPGLVDLRIEPGSVTLTDDGVDPAPTADFVAIGTFANGERDITTMVAWSLSDPDLGTLVDGEFTGAGYGGQSDVVARANTFEATATLEILLELDVTDPSAPDGIEDLFPADTQDDMVVDDDTLRIVYPSHETMFPKNLERVDHQWRADPELDRFEVRFESDLATIRWYTADEHLLPDVQGWHWLAYTHAGRSLEMTVRGVSSASPDTVVRSQPITLFYSRSEVIGALYYWSTGAEGVMKATISSSVASKFYTDPMGTDTTCVACHTVSRNGQKLSAGYGGERLRAIRVPSRDLLIPSAPTETGPEYGWGTFSPDASRLLYGNKGILHMLEADTGNEEFVVGLPTGYLAAHPDWAPSGDHVAVSYGMGKMGNKEVVGTSIARMAVLGSGMLDTPEVLLASDDGTTDTLSFPSYSPDSKWIAFARAVGKSKDAVTSVLQIVSAEGGDAVPLTRLNERVRHEDDIVDIGNAMPTWAPSTKPGIFWIAFSSLRAYGDVSGGGNDQLWGAAIDPEKLGTGEDASYAAFWMPFQDLAEGNHRAFWAIDVEQECPETIEICDDLDNDCDGVVDEDCCTPEVETCGNGADDDCDGVEDEGCDCSSVEFCNGVDDDCDLSVDEGCVG